MATHSNVLAWKITGTGEPGGCRLWGRTELDTTEATQQQQQPASPVVKLYGIQPAVQKAELKDASGHLFPS